MTTTLKGGDKVKEEKGKVVQLRRFPENLHRRAKIYAAIHDTTIKDLIVQGLTELLDRLEKKE